MSKSVALLATSEDERAAQWLARKLNRAGFVVSPWDGATAGARAEWLAAVLIVSPVSSASPAIAERVAQVRQAGLVLIPAIFRPVTEMPWFAGDLVAEDFVTDAQGSLERLRRRLAALRGSFGRQVSFDQARDAYLQRATLRSPHTLAAYRRAIQLFLDFLDDQRGDGALPILGATAATAGDIPLDQLSANDAPIFLHFAQWLLSPSSGKHGDRRPYKPTTVELRLAGILSWFQFLDDHGWLPPAFQFAKARRIVRDELRAHTRDKKPPRPPEHIEEVIYYYDALQPPVISASRIRQPNAFSDGS